MLAIAATYPSDTESDITAPGAEASETDPAAPTMSAAQSDTSAYVSTAAPSTQSASSRVKNLPARAPLELFRTAQLFLFPKFLKTGTPPTPLFGTAGSPSRRADCAAPFIGRDRNSRTAYPVQIYEE